MSDLKIKVEDVVPGFARLSTNVDLGRSFPNLLMALNEITSNMLVQWRRFTMGEPIPGCPKTIWSRGDYTKSINADLSKDYVKEVFSKGKWTEWIEKGHEEIDLKPGLLHGPKARMGKKGAYNIVSFRHGIPNSIKSNNPMPSNVMNTMRKETNRIDKETGLGTSFIISKGPGTIERRSGKKDLKTNYMWGYRLPASKGGIAQTKNTSKGDYTWSTGKHTGMVRMDASTKRARTSEYRTFRVVSINSDPASWIVPPQDPIPIRQKVIDVLKDSSEKLIKLALEEDLK